MRCGTIYSLLLLLAPALLHAESIPETIKSQLPGAAHNFVEHSEPYKELSAQKLHLKVGDRLVYDIHVNGIPAGKSVLEVQKNEKFASDTEPLVWVAALETCSNRAFSVVYSVHDKARTSIDENGGFTRSYFIDKREGDFKQAERILFKYDIGDMAANYARLRSDGQWRTHNIPLPGKVLDPLAAVYYLRSIDWKKQPVGSVIYLPICADRRVWMTKILVKARAGANEDFGNLKHRPFVKIEPDPEFKGLFERKGRMQVWIDEEKGLPLKMEVEIPIGHAEVDLNEYTEGTGQPGQ